MTAEPRTVVVGYDGSPISRDALRVAAERAQGGRLYVVYAYDLPGAMKGGVAYDRSVAEHKEAGRQVLDAMPQVTGAEVTTELIGDHAAVAIATVASVRGADEIVVGSRGFSPLRGVLGSTSHELLARAECPVTVIPPQAATE